MDKPVSEMVERVAQALCTEDERDGGAPWGYYGAKGRQAYYDRAIAAIKEMREPSDVQVAAGYEALSNGDGGPADAAVCYRAAIIAALGDTNAA